MTCLSSLFKLSGGSGQVKSFVQKTQLIDMTGGRIRYVSEALETLNDVSFIGFISGGFQLGADCFSLSVGIGR